MTRLIRILFIGLISILTGLNCGQSERQEASNGADSVLVEQTTPSGLTGQTNRESTQLTEEVSQTTSDTVEPTVESGYVLIDKQIGSPLNSGVIVALIDPVQYRPKVVGVSPSMPSGQSIVGGIQRQGADIVVGSGYVIAFYPPTPAGLLVTDSTLINPLSTRDTVLTAVIGVERDRLFINRFDEPLPEHTTGAFQVGPWLVEDGRNGIKSNEPVVKFAATRAFVGVRSSGVIVVGVTLQPVHLFHLAGYLAKSADSGGLGCVSAVNLAGGGSDGLAVKQADSVLVFRNAHQRQASILCFIRTEQP